MFDVLELMCDEVNAHPYVLEAIYKSQGWPDHIEQDCWVSNIITLTKLSLEEYDKEGYTSTGEPNTNGIAYELREEIIEPACEFWGTNYPEKVISYYNCVDKDGNQLYDRHMNEMTREIDGE